MQRALVVAVVASISIAAGAGGARAEPVTRVARGENVDVLVANAGLSRVVYAAPVDHPERARVVVAVGGLTTLQLSLAPLTVGEAKLVALSVTSTVADTQRTIQQTFAYLLRTTPAGDLEVACTVTLGARITPVGCGPGSHRDAELTSDAGTLVVTSRAFVESSAPRDGTCVADSPVAFEPTVVRYTLGDVGPCALVP